MRSRRTVKWPRKRKPVFSGIALLIFVVGYISGIVFHQYYSVQLQQSLSQLQNFAASLAQSHSIWRTVLTIFAHNAFIAGLMVVLGIFLGIFPVISIWSNGVITGLVSVMGAAYYHAPLWKVALIGLLPHGIFEIPALLWAAGIGLDFGALTFIAIRQKIIGSSAGAITNTRQISWWRQIEHGLSRVPLIFGLLFVAATLESTLTPTLIQLYLR